ncbi:DUF58 domain-containing protein [Chiayiivirga flava]|uniref:Uncharacterized protein (DUF58 family) n=1 Tax=Chiayiivirga flava TaxID=659595 RepID=A0A7W8D515_9GAMM|nr:DUF58 domain-containing protein [Chiayiivirga flava]MBB5206807.1 uncharacterized protein (DUF58 family) [Chiayiivirga flava]
MRLPAGVLAWQERALRTAERRLPALTRHKRVEALPIELTRRRIYVLPTGYGIFFGLLMGAMTIGALNYNNNPALILCFLLLSAVHTSLLRGYLGLRGLRLEAVGAEPVHAGGTQELRLLFDAAQARRRLGLVLEQGGVRVAFAVEPGQRTEVRLPRPAPRRGLQPVGRIKLATRHPLGLFVVWSWLHPDVETLVYPAPEAAAPPLPGSGERGQPRRRRGMDEEPHSLRDYRLGDPLRLIAWKRSARAQRTMVREYETPAGADVVLDWHQLAGIDSETRLRRLARWILDADRHATRSTLVLPGARIGPGSGPAHTHACLRALALMP